MSGTQTELAHEIDARLRQRELVKVRALAVSCAEWAKNDLGVSRMRANDIIDFLHNSNVRVSRPGRESLLRRANLLLRDPQPGPSPGRNVAAGRERRQPVESKPSGRLNSPTAEGDVARSVSHTKGRGGQKDARVETAKVESDSDDQEIIGIFRRMHEALARSVGQECLYALYPEDPSTTPGLVVLDESFNGVCDISVGRGDDRDRLALCSPNSPQLILIDFLGKEARIYRGGIAIDGGHQLHEVVKPPALLTIDHYPEVKIRLDSILGICHY